ncbi:putative NHN endonuclease [Variovorax sp. PBS-H4]|uniref:HNH endonuclease signature motif containing protein n=1 Tax=Variovorax sp. PBS-H4 TaxID=434008 RepID=UPI0013164DC2|nr:HNH endonuclease signature motif containing protein [Variovorax sp. PBS-H4]VTU25221.1 putative NHN endonuclease [Variovorax sp. PBS-H4]
MKTPCTAEQLRGLMRYDPETGHLWWKPRKAGRGAVDRPAGHLGDQGYVCVQLLGKIYKAHRLAWLYVHGAWPEHGIDHVNGDRADNRIANLREASPTVNRNNVRAARRDSKTGFMGVNYQPRKRSYRATIQLNGRNKHLGTFKDPESAHQAYLDAKRQHHEGFQL